MSELNDEILMQYLQAGFNSGIGFGAGLFGAWYAFRFVFEVVIAKLEDYRENRRFERLHGTQEVDTERNTAGSV